jgi:hypothetical protein
MIASRPDLAEVLIGRFWLAHDEEHAVPGRLTLADGASPRLELDQAVTPSLRELDRQQQPDGTVRRTLGFAEDGPDHESLVVHGALDDGTLVTLIEAFTVGRTLKPFAPDGGQDRQSLHAQSALLGGHVGGRDEPYTQVRLQLRHLDDWAALPGFALETVDPRQGWATLTFRGSGPSPVSLATGGRFELEQVPRIEFSAVHGGGIRRVLWLRAVDLPKMTADDLARRFVTPLASLLTLATGTDCPPMAIEIATGYDQPWLSMHHSGLREATIEVLPTHQQLLPLAALGLDRVASWLGAVERLGPLPPVVAAAAAGPGRTLETQLLELTTVAEGLHRRLFADTGCLSPEQAKAAQPAFAQRMEQLADCVAAAIPGVTGQTNCWTRRVTDLRNEFAHRKYGFLEAGRVPELLAIQQSLRWLLTGLLLLQTGLPPDELAAQIEDHQPYRLFREQAREWLPDVFPAPSDQ